MISFTIEFGTDKLVNDRANRTRVVFDCGVLERVEKNRRVDNASVNNICRQVIVSCGGHFDRGGGEFVMNHCGCHLTLKIVRLYLTCGCYVIINQISYTRVLIRI